MGDHINSYHRAIELTVSIAFSFEISQGPRLGFFPQFNEALRELDWFSSIVGKISKSI